MVCDDSQMVSTLIKMKRAGVWVSGCIVLMKGCVKEEKLFCRNINFPFFTLMFVALF
jgi:hypothetical protein